jgi:hypothetical protein
MSTPSNSITPALAQLPVYDPPTSLFRFNRSGDLHLLRDGKIKLTPPAYFNDPFEMFAGIDASTLTEAKVVASVTAPKGIFKAAIRANNPKLLLDEQHYDQAMADLVRKTPAMWAQHLSSITNSVRSLSKDRIGAACLSAFSDSEILAEVGIHHWAMYGDEHRGFAIEYNGNHSYFQTLAKSKWLFPVEYLNERLQVDINYFDNWGDEPMWRTIRSWAAMKSKVAWGHEKEWRILHSIGGDEIPHAWWYGVEGVGEEQRYYLKLWSKQHTDEQKVIAGAGAIRRVWLGCRSTLELQEEILEAIRVPYLKHVELIKLGVCERQFRLIATTVAK